MENKSRQSTGIVKKDLKNTWTIIFAVVVTSFLTGAIVFVWHNQQTKILQDQLYQVQVIKSQIEKEKSELEKKYCKGVWENGICITTTCVDSDVNEKPNDIYIKGNVTYTDESGVSTTVSDECTGSKTQVNEKWCYESPQGSGNYVPGGMIYDCPKGCFDGACMK